MIVDDVQVGCGRTGYFFSFERAGIIPDIVAISKSIGGCGMPLSMVLFKPELDIWEPGQHTGTFRGNQLSLIAGKSGLEMLFESDLLCQVQRKGKIVENYLYNEICSLDSRITVRGIGLIWGVDISKLGCIIPEQVVSLCFNSGLIVERVGRDNSVIKIMPPLVIEDDLLIRGLSILKNAIKEILQS